MSYEVFVDEAERDFTLTCPGPNSDDMRVVEILGRGNLPLLIGEDVMAEINRDDLMESWQAAMELTPAQLRDMTKVAGGRLSDMMAQDRDAADLTELVSDAAVMFLLVLRRHGVKSAERIPPCRVKWIGQLHSEQLSLLRDVHHS